MRAPLSVAAALSRTALMFGVVSLAWLLAASVLPNFHVADATPTARVVFVVVVLALLSAILLAQLAMLRAWFGSLLTQQPGQARGIGRLRVAVLALIALGVAGGLAVLWYTTAHWMPLVQESVREK